MDRTKEAHSRWLHIRLKEEEHNEIYNKFTISACRKLSEYARRVLLDKPITVKTRNGSLDEFMAEMIRLREELHLATNGVEEAVKKLQTLQNIDELKLWLLLYETTRKAVAEKVEIIKQKINTINDQWLQ